jgi:hypothetical protein
MKRGNNIDYSIIKSNKKGKGNNLDDLSSRKISEYFQANAKRAKSKSKILTIDLTQSPNDVLKTKKQINLVKNPSKQCLKYNQVDNVMNYNNSRNKLLINENTIHDLKNILEPFFENLKDSLFKQNINNFLQKEIYDSFYQTNLNTILTKFMLQVDDYFIYVPRSFMSEIDHLEKEKMVFLTGFNNTKYISLQYQPEIQKDVK